MALSTDDVNAVMAEWEKWAADAGFRLSIEVKGDPEPAELVMGDPPGSIGARLVSRLYCQVQVWRGDELVFEERVPYDAGMLRASVTVVARTIAAQKARVLEELIERGEGSPTRDDADRAAGAVRRHARTDPPS